MLTGLVKVCPRCGRMGLVSPDRVALDGEALFRIDWPGPARNALGEARDVCRLVRLRELLSPAYGCGYDEGAAVQKAATP